MIRPQKVFIKVCNETIGEETSVFLEENVISRFLKVKQGYVFRVEKHGETLTIGTGDETFIIKIKRIELLPWHVKLLKHIRGYVRL
jgi:hypothetical protein